METAGDVATHPVVVWTTVACAVVIAVAWAVAKVAEPITQALMTRRRYMAEIEAARRQQEQEIEDARIVDLSQQVDHLAGRVWTLEQYADRQNTFLHEHAIWDHQVMTAAIAAGLDVPAPPPLRPPLDPP